MTPAEFKSWFEGFTELMDKVPTQKAWTRIKERVAEIDGKPVTQQVFIDRYWPSISSRPGVYWSPLAMSTMNVSNSPLIASGAVSTDCLHNSAAVMNAVGKYDYESLTE